MEALVATLAAHPHLASVQTQGAWCLRNLTTIDENELRAGDAGAAEVLVVALRAFETQAEVVEHVLRALKNMTNADSNKVRTVSESRRCVHVDMVLGWPP